MPGPNENVHVSFLDKEQALFRGALIFLLTLLVYFPVFQAGLIWDDAVMLTDNPLIKASDGLRSIWFSTQSADYFPLTLTTFWLEWRLWGDWLGGYHLVNVILHAVGALLFWRVLLRLRVKAAWLCAAVFALHPICVASVAWIAERKNTLSIVFYLLTILLYLRFEGAQDSAPKTKERASRRKWYVLSLFAFLLALLSKTSVVMLPFVLLLCDWWQRPSPPLGAEEREKSEVTAVAVNRVFRLAPYFLLSLILGLVTVWFQTHRAIGESPYLEDTLFTRLLGGSWATWFYLWKDLLPLHLSMIYPQWNIDVRHPVSYGPVLAWLGLIGLLFWKRSSWGRVWLFGLGCFLFNLAPVLGVFRMFFFNYSKVADHWQYLSLLSVIALFVGGAAWLLGTAFSRNVQVVYATVLLAVLGVLTSRQSATYQNAETLWSDTLQKNPQAWMAHNNLGIELETKGEIEQARFQFSEALRLRPGNADAHYNLGKSFALEGRIEEAISHYEQALASEPKYIKAHNNLGMILEDQGKVAEAEEHYREAIRALPKYVVAQNNLAQLLLKEGKLSEGMEHAAEAVRLSPEFSTAHYNLANAYSLQGKRAEAETQYREALRLNPNHAEAHYNLANLLARDGKLLEAKGQYLAALKLKPTLPGANNNLGQILLLEGDAKGAERAYAQAVALNGNDDIAQHQLAMILSSEGRWAEAIAHFESALRVRPELPEAHYNFGNALLHQGKKEEAAQHYLAALRYRPDYAEAHYQSAMLFLASGRADLAISHLRDAVRLKPDWREAMNNLSWILATSPDAALRNGEEALRLATKARQLAGQDNFETLDTLAAAYAEAGQFSNAVVTAQSALQLAANAGSPQASSPIQARLQLYQSQRPYRDDLNGNK